MTEPILLGLLLLALAGWSLFIVLYARALLSIANAFKVMHQIDAHFDKRINDVLDRARANTAKTKPTVPDGRASAQETRTQINNELSSVFGAPLIPIDEQPDPLEVVDA